jgi:hypothetical protein
MDERWVNVKGVVEAVVVRGLMDKQWSNIACETSLVECQAEMAYGEGFGSMMQVYGDAGHPTGCPTCFGQG